MSNLYCLPGQSRGVLPVTPPALFGPLLPPFLGLGLGPWAGPPPSPKGAGPSPSPEGLWGGPGRGRRPQAGKNTPAGLLSKVAPGMRLSAFAKLRTCRRNTSRGQLCARQQGDIRNFYSMTSSRAKASWRYFPIRFAFAVLRLIRKLKLCRPLNWQIRQPFRL